MAKRIVPFCILLAACLSAYAGPILDLSSFYADPEVSFSLAGAVATFTESATHMETILSDDPGLGNPELIFAGPDLFVTFDYAFVVGEAGNNDEFGAWLIDPATGWSAGAPYEFFLNTSGSGTISWDLSGLGLAGPWGIQFQLSSMLGDSGADSTLQVSNLQIVPEPVTIVGLGALLAGILGARRRRR